MYLLLCSSICPLPQHNLECHLATQKTGENHFSHYEGDFTLPTPLGIFQLKSLFKCLKYHLLNEVTSDGHVKVTSHLPILILPPNVFFLCCTNLMETIVFKCITIYCLSSVSDS